jgi:hypothetical protein
MEVGVTSPISLSVLTSVGLESEIDSSDDLSISLQAVEYIEADIETNDNVLAALSDTSGLVFYYFSASNLEPTIQVGVLEFELLLDSNISIYITTEPYLESDVGSQGIVMPTLEDRIEEKYMMLYKTIRPHTAKDSMSRHLNSNDVLDANISNFVEILIPVETASMLSVALNSNTYIESGVAAEVEIAPEATIITTEKEMHRDLGLDVILTESVISTTFASSDSLQLTFNSEAEYFLIQPTVIKEYDGAVWVKKTEPVYIKQSDGTWLQSALKTKQADGSWQ